MTRLILPVIGLVLLGSHPALANTELANRIERLREAAALPSMKPFDPNELNQRDSLVSQFDVVIWVNKATSGTSKQRLEIWTRGQKSLTTKVSTGREKWEKSRAWIWGKGPRNSYFSSTNVGYFTPHHLSPMHTSKLWGTKMPWSIFFDEGIAIHQAPPDAEYALGSRASGGCVRVSGSVAAEIYNLVLGTQNSWIPEFTRDGNFVLDSITGQPRRKRGYSTLIIVEDRVTQ
jgi:hypothetical protein